jgi:hypothetical protein
MRVRPATPGAAVSTWAVWVFSLWSTRNQTQLLGDRRGKIKNCWDSGTQFWLSSTIEVARNRLELALGRKQPSTTTNHRV